MGHEILRPAAQLFDGVEGMHPEEVPLQGVDEGFCQSLRQPGSLPERAPQIDSGLNGWEPEMDCVCCGSVEVTERPGCTAQRYRRFHCRDCGKQFNERSGGLLNRAQYPSDVIALVVLWRLLYRLTLRDLSEMFLVRGIVFSYEAVREWEAKIAPLLTDELRRRRHGKSSVRNRQWHVDETYLKVRGRWCYLYRAIDRDGNLVDTLLSEHYDMAAAQAFFRSAKSATGVTPDRVTTDAHGSYSRAIRSVLGRRVVHRTSAYKNNRLEQDHRGVKGRIRCMRGFKSFASAERFCRSYDELRNHLRPRIGSVRLRARWPIWLAGLSPVAFKTGEAGIGDGLCGLRLRRRDGAVGSHGPRLHRRDGSSTSCREVWRER